MSDGADQSEIGTSPAGPPSLETRDAPQPFFQRIDWLTFGITTFLALMIYLSTLAPEVTLEFSGILSTSANYAAVSNPPGYPVWTLYSWLFVTILPFGNVAWRVAVGSAVATSLACGLVGLMVSRGGAMLLETTPAFLRLKSTEQKLLRVVCGYVAGMALGLSSTIWREAVVAEVWAVTVLLFITMLCLLTRWMARPERRRFLYAAVFFFGLLLTGNEEQVPTLPCLLLAVLLGDQALGRDLSLLVVVLAVADWVAQLRGSYSFLGAFMKGNVWLATAFLLLGVAGVIAVVRTRRFGSELASAAACVLMLALGLGICFYLPVTSMTNPPVNWGYPRTVEGFLHLISRGQYESPHPTDLLSRFIEQLLMLLKLAWKGLGWPFVILATFPFCLLGHTSRCARNWLLGLIAVLLGVGPLVVALLNPTNDRASVDWVQSFFAVMYVVLAVLAGLGLMVFGSVLAKPRRHASLDGTSIS